MRKRARLIRARLRAPKHPPGPEARVRLTITRIFLAYHRHIKKTVLAHVWRPRHDATHLRLHAGLTGARALGAELLRKSKLREAAKKAAEQTAGVITEQLAEVLDLDLETFDPTMEAEQLDYAERIVEGVEDKMALSIERAQDVLDEWEDLDPETSPRAGDPWALGLMLDEGLDGVMGGALAWGAIAFGDMFAEMNKAGQEEAGVAQYIWVSQHDSRVRDAHEALDGEVCDWDDPPLTADESSSGEDCHPGEDYNCRCIASPIAAEEGEEESEAEAA